MKNFSKLLTITMTIGALSLTTACARDMSGRTYVDNATTGIVLEGVVVSARQVTVKSSDKAGESMGVGTLGGAAMGGIGGNTLGKGSGNAAATVGGVLIGGLIGHLLEDQLGQSQAMEYIVKVDEDNLDAAGGDKLVTVNRGNTIKDKVVSNSNIKTKTKLISVVQGLDQVFSTGQKVYVIYNDNRPRLAPAL
jgi:outer membrane lipoprotein SlyB